MTAQERFNTLVDYIRNYKGRIPATCPKGGGSLRENITDVMWIKGLPHRKDSKVCIDTDACSLSERRFLAQALTTLNLMPGE